MNKYPIKTIDNTKSKTLKNKELYSLTIKFYNKPTSHVFYGKTKYKCNSEFRKAFGFVLPEITKTWDIINEKDKKIVTTKVEDNDLLEGTISILISKDGTNFSRTRFIPFEAIPSLIKNLKSFLLNNDEIIRNFNKILVNPIKPNFKVEHVNDKIFGECVKIDGRINYSDITDLIKQLKKII